MKLRCFFGHDFKMLPTDGFMVRICLRCGKHQTLVWGEPISPLISINKGWVSVRNYSGAKDPLPLNEVYELLLSRQ